jgi:hypothetical protein
MSEEMPPDPVTRRALVVWYDDETNTVSLDDDAFSYLEVPELLRAALDIAEENLPTRAYADDTEDNT